MSAYTLIWQEAAVAGLIRERARDPESVRMVRSAIRILAVEPRPAESSPLGTQGLHRLRIDDLRILYRVDDERESVEIITVGRSPRTQGR